MNNPAARLLHLIQKGKKIDATKSCSAAWLELLDVPANKPSLLYKRIGITMTLVEQINNCAQRLDTENVRPYLAWQPNINKAFAGQNLQSNWGSFISHIDGHTINYLSLAAEMFATKIPEPILSTEELEEFELKFQELLEEIEESDLEEEIKSFMTDKIHEIITSLEEYKLTGIVPILKNLNGTLGYAIINNEIKTKTEKTDLGQKFWRLIVSASVIVSLASGVQQLSPSIKNLLPFIEENEITDEGINAGNESIIIDTNMHEQKIKST